MNKYNKVLFSILSIVAVSQASFVSINPQINSDDILQSILLGDSIDLFAQGYGGGSGGYDCQFISGGSSGSTSNGTAADTTVELELCGGDLTIDVPDNVSFGSLAISAATTTASTTIPYVRVNDLRGANAGWDVTATMTNFGGQSNSSQNILIYDNNTSTSYLDVTPGTVSVFGGVGSLNGVNEYNYTQSTDGVSGTSSSDESDPYSIMGFSSGNGAGQFTVPVDMDLSILPYTYAQTYQSTFTATVV